MRGILERGLRAALTMALTLACALLADSPPAHAAPRGGPLAGRVMWIWMLSAAEQGDPTAIVHAAHLAGIGTVIIKAGDGSTPWAQFNAQLVRTMHAEHLRVCAWQYVYGSYPVAEAAVGARAVADGADCLVVDAEVEYQGKYVQAQTYLQALRRAVGNHYPLALAGLPYIDYHPAFPYSVFLGPGGVNYNVPQMYWQDIGQSVDAVYAHTFAFNRIYGRPIFPLGQLYGSPGRASVVRFRGLSLVYRTAGLSWWDWQEAGASQWQSLSSPIWSLAGLSAYPALATIGHRARGDLVVWAEEHLIAAGYPMSINGAFDPGMVAIVKRFQAARGLTPDGLIGTETWKALLRYPAVHVHWFQRGLVIGAHLASARAAAAGGHSGRSALAAAASGLGLAAAVPASASLPQRRNELRGVPGRGHPAAARGELSGRGAERAGG